MARNSKVYAAICQIDFEHVIPAYALEIRKTGRAYDNVDATIDFPEKRIPYKAGQRVVLCSARNLKDFCAAHAGKFVPEVR